jgi:23S rRNA (guanosine2251-2'-O)-methyltransferase
LPDYAVPPKIALLLGREVEGVEPELLKQMDDVLEIPMSGQKESFNVTQAAAMAIYHCRFAHS